MLPSLLVFVIVCHYQGLGMSALGGLHQPNQKNGAERL